LVHALQAPVVGQFFVASLCHQPDTVTVRLNSSRAGQRPIWVFIEARTGTCLLPGGPSSTFAGGREWRIGLNNSELWVAAQGAGPPLVLCTGGAGLCDYLGPVAAMVDDLVQVYRFDPRGVWSILCVAAVRSANLGILRPCSRGRLCRRHRRSG
jgi:hypothetical protein